jgi:hypothetical protein
VFVRGGGDDGCADIGIIRRSDHPCDFFSRHVRHDQIANDDVELNRSHCRSQRFRTVIYAYTSTSHTRQQGLAYLLRDWVVLGNQDVNRTGMSRRDMSIAEFARVGQGRVAGVRRMAQTDLSRLRSLSTDTGCACCSRGRIYRRALFRCGRCSHAFWSGTPAGNAVIPVVHCSYLVQPVFRRPSGIG